MRILKSILLRSFDRSELFSLETVFRAILVADPVSNSTDVPGPIPICTLLSSGAKALRVSGVYDSWAYNGADEL